MKTLLALMATALLFPLGNKNVQEYLSAAGPLNFNDTEFQLKWSDKPNDNYYIQEYLPEGETLERYNQMLTIHLFETNTKLKDAVGQKIQELTERKKTDPVCNYQVTESPDGKEFMVDFLMGQSEGEQMTLVEFNIYHYRQIDLGKKKKAIAVYAYTKRSYGDDIRAFFSTLKVERNKHLNQMISAPKPKIELKSDN